MNLALLPDNITIEISEEEKILIDEYDKILNWEKEYINDTYYFYIFFIKYNKNSCIPYMGR
jgi:hypothetical protein